MSDFCGKINVGLVDLRHTDLSVLFGSTALLFLSQATLHKHFEDSE